VFAGSLILVSLFFGACARYEFEFAPALALLAALGILAAESFPGPRWRLARALWVPALAFSVAFPMLYGIDRCVLDHDYNGIGYAGNGDALHAEREFAIARALSPGNRFSRLALGAVLSSKGESTEALGIFEGLVRDEPGYAMAQFDLAHELAVQGRLDEAVAHYEIAHSLEPGDMKMLSALDAARAARARPRASPGR
jgi:tetratricopeptide (TPR) repeat protein